MTAILSKDIVTEAQVILTAIRQELKEWEKSFAAVHKGRRPGREDIKRNPGIGTKYKEYDRLRRPSSKASAPQDATPSKKRQRPATVYSPPVKQIPSKRPKHKHHDNPATLCEHEHELLHPTHVSPLPQRISIGPTPQKDGHILGILDGLSSASNSKTPSKRKALAPLMNISHLTPSKRSTSQGAALEPPSTGKRHQQSPLSNSKQTHINTFLTPSSRRIIGSNTPASRDGVSKLHFDETPAFLRRDSQRAFSGKENEGADESISWSPITVRKLSKPAGRGLSTLVKGLRDMEEEALDEDLDILREIEGGGEKGGAGTVPKPKVLVGNSQRPDMPLGPDGEHGGEGESGDDDVEEHEGKRRKVWKKKGQKRTTRRVIMKPNTAKWKPEPAWKGGKEDGSDKEGNIEETQLAGKGKDFDEDDYADELDLDKGDEKEAIGTNKNEEGKGGAKADNLGTKIRKKISATAHANFRALKIRNKNSKAKGRGRFGRR